MQGPVASAGGRVRFGSTDGFLHRVSAAGGYTVWTFDAGGRVESPPASVRDGFARHHAGYPYPTEGLVIVATDARKVYRPQE